MESRGTARMVKAKFPLSEMFGYVTDCIAYDFVRPRNLVHGVLALRGEVLPTGGRSSESEW